MVNLTFKAPDMLKEWLQKRERTIAWFARMIGVSKTTVHAWISGRSTPSHLHRELIQELTKINRFSWVTEQEEKYHKKISKKISNYHRSNK